MKLNANNTTKRFIGNTGWMMGQQVYSMVLSLIIGSISARYLGPSNYGLLNYGTSIISFFTIISRLGMQSVVVNEMVKEPDKRGEYLGTALFAQFITSIASLLCIVAIVAVLEPDNRLLQIVTFLQAISVILQTYEVFTYWFQVELRMKFVSIASMIALTAVSIWKVSLLATGASVQWFALSLSVQYLVCGVVVAGCFIKQSKLRLAFRFDTLKYLLKRSHHFIISGIAVTLYSQIDKIMIGKMMSETDLGFYTAASVIACLWEFIPTALVNSARPLIMEAKGEDEKKYIARFQDLLLGISAMALVVSLGISLFGKIAILILYGRNYMPAQWPLAILVWSTGFAVLGTARSIWIVTEGYNKYEKNFTIIGAIINVILNATLIPSMGIIGASIATLLSQMFVCLGAPLLYKDTRQFDKILFSSFKRMPKLIEKMKESAKK